MEGFSLHKRSTAGNKHTSINFVERFFHPKQAMRQLNGLYEHEAGAMADKITHMQIPSPEQNFFSPSFIQRKCGHCEEEESAFAKASADKEKIQRKEMNREETTGDGELENYPDNLMSTDTKSLQTKSENNLFFKPVPIAINPIQRKCAHCEEEESAFAKASADKEKMQRKEMNGEEAEADSSLQNYVGGLAGSGQPLPNEVRSFYEPRFGYDFSNVKLHTDPVAAKSAQSINALAYTSGNNIVFSSGQYSPDTHNGKKLLGHELTHVIQQASFNRDNKIQAQHRCDPPELNPCPDRQFNLVMAAFRTASNWLANAQQRINDYISAPAAVSNRRARNALRNHFRWTENVRQQTTFPDIPHMVLNVITNALRNIQVAIGADCPTSVPSSDREGGILHARTTTTWNLTNCYIFYPPFFNRTTTDRQRAKTAIHEMMHRWEGMTDILYEWENGYPPSVRSSQSNSDSYAALIRDLGET